jgi:hypothetical protein
MIRSRGLNQHDRRAVEKLILVCRKSWAAISAKPY